LGLPNCRSDHFAPDALLQVHGGAGVGLHLYESWSLHPQLRSVAADRHGGVSGRIGSGIVELIAAVLLLTPRFVWAGAILAMAATGGAIVSHLTFLGIEVQGDKGLLFFLAITVLVTSIIALFLHRMQIPVFGRKF